MFFLNLLIFILVLGVIILIHELGHFFFAKKAGILCHEFSIGMGPAIYQKRKGETIYSIRGIPIGGYVSMAGEAVNDALIRKDQVIGVVLNAQGQIKEIILDSELRSDVIGIVKSFDLYGKDFDPLFIELDVQGKTERFSVLREAIYRINAKKEMWITPSEKSFESKTLWQRFLVIFAGPAMNFILALFLFMIIGFFAVKPNLESSTVDLVSESSAADMIGMLPGDTITMINGASINSWTDLQAVMDQNDSVYIDITFDRNGTLISESDVVITTIIQTAGIANLSADGLRYHDQAIVGQVFGRASSDGGLSAGDEIYAIRLNGVVTPIDDWNDLIGFFTTYTRGDLEVLYLREGVEGIASYEMISARALEKLGYQSMVFQIGISPESGFDWGYTLVYPYRTFYSNMMQVFNTLGLLFDRQENLGITDLSGPVGIFSLVSSTTSQGLIAILGFTAFLSINIGLLNLLPIPALDGGRLVFLGIEAVTRKPLNRKLENTINNVMFFLLLGLFVFVTYNDIVRLIRG